MIDVGMILFSSNKKGLLPKFIRFFTNSKVSQVAVGTFPVGMIPSIQESSQLIQVIPFKRYVVDPHQEYVVYRIKPGIVSEAFKKDAVRYCFSEFGGVHYGYLQSVWVVWAWLYRKIFKKKLIPQTKNWFTEGVICSELVYYYLIRLGDRFEYMLKGYNGDTIQAQDILELVQANPDVFEEVGRKGLV